MALVGAAFAVDERYVHKGEMYEVKDSIVQNRRDNLADKIFEIELKPEQRRSPADKALLDRYKSQIREIDSKRQKP